MSRDGIFNELSRKLLNFDFEIKFQVQYKF